VEVRTEGDLVVREISIARHDPGYRATRPVGRGIEIEQPPATRAGYSWLAYGTFLFAVAIAVSLRIGAAGSPVLAMFALVYLAAVPMSFLWLGLDALRSFRVVSDDRVLEIVSGSMRRRRRYRGEIDEATRGAIAARGNRLMIGGCHAADLRDPATAALVARLLDEWLGRERRAAVRVADDLEPDAAAVDDVERATPPARRAR
jgi:hypothetical protein